MDKRPSIDRDLLIPILVGGISVFGILMILLVARLSESRAALPVEQTETPFKYVFLGTEPGITTGSPEVLEPELLTNVPLESPTPRPTNATPALGTPTPAASNSTASPELPSDSDGGPPINVTLPANTSVPTSNPGSGPPPLNPGTYDDAHSYLAYDGPGWSATDVGGGKCGSNQGTLHVSQIAGSSVSFSFIGRELHLLYQGGNNLGSVIISIDSQTSVLDESGGNEWISSLLTNGTHTVTITHATGGGSVNLDCVIIPEVATPTPTRTP